LIESFRDAASAGQSVDRAWQMWREEAFRAEPAR
jgi:hypothetical protein